VVRRYRLKNRCARLVSASRANVRFVPRPAWMSRNLLVLSGVSLFQDAASELLYPILPIFLTSVLGAPTAVVGAVEGVAEGAASAAKLSAGRLADRFRRRPLIGAGYGLAAVGKVLIAVAVVWPVVLIGRVVDRIGKGVRGAPRDALLVVGVPPEARGRAFGLHRAADTTGAVIGPLIGLAGYELLHHRIRPLLVIAVVPAIVSVALVAWVRESAAPPVRAPITRKLESRDPLPTAYWHVVAVLTLFALVNFPDALILLKVHELGYSLGAVIGVYILYNAVYALLSYPFGALSDRLPRRYVFATGLACFATCYIGLGVVDGTALIVPLLAIYGGFTAATDAVGKAWVSSLAPVGRQGSAQGIFQGLSGAGILGAGLWAGFAWGGDGQVPLLVSGAVAAVVALYICRLP
jgi:MFS family permease